MINEEEYKALRQELLHSYTIVDSSRNILYITVAYILTFATTQGNSYLYLLPFAVIIPIYLIAINYTFDMYRICTYIMVFGENETNNYKWETRQYKLNTQSINSMPRQAKTFHIPYVFLGAACAILFFSSIDYKNISATSILCLITGIVLTLILLSIFLYYQDMISVQNKYKTGWEEVQKAERTKHSP